MIKFVIMVPTLKNNTIWRSSRILTRSDRIKASSIFVIQAFLGLLDVAAVLALGLVSALSVAGVSSDTPGERIVRVLNILNIEDKSIQFQVAFVGLIASLILVFKSIASLYMSRKVLFFLGRRSAYISRTLIVRLLGDSLIKVRSKTIQENIYTLTGGVQVVMINILGATVILLSDILLLIFFSASLFFIDTTVAFLSLIIFSSLGIVLYVKMHKKAEKLGAIATKLGIQSSDQISEVVSCYRELLVKGRRGYYSEKIGSMRLGMAEASANLSVMQLVSKYIMEISMVIATLMVGVTQFLSQPATRAVGVIGIFLLASARIVPAVLRVQTGLVSLKMHIGTASMTLNMIEEYVGENGVGDTLIGPISIPDFQHQGFDSEIQLLDVKYRYPHREKYAISQVSLTVQMGEFLAIVGPSGAGKTTLVDLMIGVLEPESGTISVSGTSPATAVNLWPGAIAYVPQDANIVNGSFKDNVCLGFEASQVDDELVKRILLDVELKEVLSLPGGIHANVGERGNLLSGGQRQRLGIARALFTNPKLLILDESTSALDANTEARLSKYLLSLKGKVTLIVIAHRLSTVRHADRILYLESGQSIGVGTFNQLRLSVPEFDKQAIAMGL